MKHLALIPARSGSKRIPEKNIKDFMGKPIMVYSIESAIQSALFDEVMVSTDSSKYAEIAQKYGAKTPFIRSADNSNDFAGTAEVISEVLEQYAIQNKYFNYVTVIYPTAPFVTADLLKEAWAKISAGDLDAVITICKYSYPPQRALRVAEDLSLKMFWPENYSARSQDLEPFYHDAGQLYMLKTDSFLTNRKLFLPKMAGLFISNLRAQDIDSIEDWKLAELKFQYLNK